MLSTTKSSLHKCNIQRILPFLLILVLLSPLLCSSTVSAAVKINKSKATIYVGDDITLKITGTKSKVRWVSSNPSIAYVDSYGNVYGLSSGKATITATVSKKTYTSTITVKSLYNQKTVSKNLATKITDLNNEIIIQLKNTGKYPYEVSAVVEFYDEKNKLIQTEYDTVYYLEPNKYAILSIIPLDKNYDIIKYSSYEINYTFNDITYSRSIVDDIEVIGHVNDGLLKVTATNKSKEPMEFGRVAIVFYKDKKIIHYYSAFLTLRDDHMSEAFDLLLPYDENLDPVEYDSYRFIVNHACYYPTVQ